MNAAAFRELINREYLKGLRDPQRPMRNRVNILRKQGRDDRAAALEAALDRINAAFAERDQPLKRERFEWTISSDGKSGSIAA